MFYYKLGAAHANSPLTVANPFKVGADFDDSVTTGQFTFLLTTAGPGGGGGRGVYRTTNDGTGFAQYLGFNRCTSVHVFDSTTFLVGEDPDRLGSGTTGDVNWTANTFTGVQVFDDGNSALPTNNYPATAICTQTANLTHWMVACNGPNSGIMVTTNGDQGIGGTTFTAFDTSTNPALPSDNALSCAYWNGTGATGATWMVGTDAGLVLTTNGGGNLSPVRRTTYTTGTATFTATSPTVNGAGTAWSSSGIAAGWMIQLDGATGWYTVQSVDTDTQITLSANVAAADAGNGTYTAYSTIPTGYQYVEVNETKPTNTQITYDILDGGGSVLIANQIPTSVTGNPQTGTIDISGISYATDPVIQVRATLTTTNSAVTPSIHRIRIAFTYP
jgi:hypothetical protein